MAKLNRKCIICHKKYSYCPSCAADSNKPTWMILFCSNNCRDLYNILNDYSHKLLTKEDAYNKLKGLEISCADELPWNFKENLNEILNAGIAIEEDAVKPLITEDVVEEQKISIKEVNKQNGKVIKEETVKNEIIEEVNEEEIRKPRYNKKKAKSIE